MGNYIPGFKAQLLFSTVRFSLYQGTDDANVVDVQADRTFTNVTGKFVTAIPPKLSNPNDPNSWTEIVLYYEAVSVFSWGGLDQTIVYRVPVIYRKNKTPTYFIDIVPNTDAIRPTAPPLIIVSFNGTPAPAKRVNYIVNNKSPDSSRFSGCW